MAVFKVTTNTELANPGPWHLGEHTGLGSCEPLVTTFSSPLFVTFVLCVTFCLIDIVGSLISRNMELTQKLGINMENYPLKVFSNPSLQITWVTSQHEHSLPTCFAEQKAFSPPSPVMSKQRFQNLYARFLFLTFTTAFSPRPLPP